jgi:alkaline phosphatase
MSGVAASPLLTAAADTAVRENKKLFGLYGGTGGNFESPVPVDNPGAPQVNIGSEENPWLADCVDATLKVLSNNDNGFFVMFEQGDIDWANHALDYARMVGCTYDLDKAVKAAVAFVNKPGDDIHWGNTLMIVTSDHSNSYMRLDPVKTLGKGDLPAQVPFAVDPVYGPQFNNGSYTGGEVTYQKGEHTNELVTLSAGGSHAFSFYDEFEGKWYPGTRIVDNTHIYHVMKNATKLFP